MIQIGDKVKLWFDERQKGGMVIDDNFGFLKKISVEVVRPGTHVNCDYNQSYKCPNPQVTSGPKWVRSQGSLHSFSQGKIPVSYDILTKVEDSDVAVDMKLVFEEDLSNIGLVKAWMWLNAIKVYVEEKTSLESEKSQAISLSSNLPKWTQAYVGQAKTVTFINPNGALQLLSKKVSEYVDDRIWVHSQWYSEFVTVLFQKAGGVSMKKGKEFTCLWKLRYVPGGW